MILDVEKMSLKASRVFMMSLAALLSSVMPYLMMMDVFHLLCVVAFSLHTTMTVLHGAIYRSVL
jgi:hypothetical protein